MSLGDSSKHRPPTSIVDIEYNPRVSGGFSPISNARVAQGFVPSLPVLTGIELQFTAFDGPSHSMTVTVLIRKDSIDSPAIATSSSIEVSGSLRHSVRFEFSPPAKVKPGDNYLFELTGIGDPYVFVSYVWHTPARAVIEYPDGFAQWGSGQTKFLQWPVDILFTTYGFDPRGTVKSSESRHRQMSGEIEPGHPT